MRGSTPLFAKVRIKLTQKLTHLFRRGFWLRQWEITRQSRGGRGSHVLLDQSVRLLAQSGLGERPKGTNGLNRSKIKLGEIGRIGAFRPRMAWLRQHAYPRFSADRRCRKRLPYRAATSVDAGFANTPASFLIWLDISLSATSRSALDSCAATSQGSRTITGFLP